MREIKFRGKREDNGEWVFGDYGQFHKRDGGWTHEIHCPIPKISGSFWNEVIPETVGQYTGLHDKNGKEIYEGDLLKTEENDIYRVAFIESSCAFVACFYPDDYDTVYLTDTVPNTYDEVIGNIHDGGDS